MPLPPSRVAGSPFLGFVLGLTQINRNSHGLRIVLASVAFFFIWYSMLG